MSWGDRGVGRGSIARANFDRWSSMCGDLIAEAERQSAKGVVGGTYFQLMNRASDVLDDMDEVLLALHVEREHPKFSEAVSLHQRFERCLQQIPPPLRGHMRRARRVAEA